MARHIQISEHATEHAARKEFRLPQIAGAASVPVEASTLRRISKAGDAVDLRGKMREGAYVVTAAHDDPCIPAYTSVVRGDRVIRDMNGQVIDTIALPIKGRYDSDQDGNIIDTWAIPAPAVQTRDAGNVGKAFAAAWGTVDPDKRELNNAQKYGAMVTCKGCQLQFRERAIVAGHCPDCR